MFPTKSIFVSRISQSCRVRCMFFTSYGLAWSTTWGSVSLLQVEGQSTKVSLHVENSATINETGQADFLRLWSNLDPHPLVHIGSLWIIFTVVFQTHVSKLEWDFLRTRKTPRWQWGSNPGSMDRRSKVFYQLSYPTATRMLRKTKFLPEPGIKPGMPSARLSVLSTNPLLHCNYELSRLGAVAKQQISKW